MTPRPSAAKIKKRPGFAALLSVLIMTGIALTVSLALFGVYTLSEKETVMRQDAVQARALSMSCADIALLRLTLNTGYTGNENVTVDSLTCHISTVLSDGDARTVNADATVNGSTSRAKVEIADVYQMFVNSWTEIP